MAFTPRLTSDGMYGNPWWYSTGNPFYIDPDNRLPNCTCYAYGRYAEIRNGFADLPTGNAGGWWDDPRAANFQRGQEPQLGAIACYYSPTGAGLGHVCVVEEIKPNGDIVTSNSGYGYLYFYVRTYTRSSGYYPGVADYVLQGFIYNDAVDGRISNPYTVAAIAGNFAVESNVNPGIWESLQVKTWDYVYDPNNPNQGGYGLGQWTNVSAGGRLWKLHEWVTANGYADGDGDGQMEYIIHEDYWVNSSSTIGSYTTLTEFLNYNATSSDLYMLTHDWLVNWEGIGTGTLNTRYQYAQDFLSHIQQHQNDDPSTYHWISTNTYLSDADMKNNVMCMYFWLTSGTPIPPEPEKKKGMPLWMYLNYNPFYF